MRFSIIGLEHETVEDDSLVLAVVENVLTSSSFNKTVESLADKSTKA